jgi:hypothetical protein
MLNICNAQTNKIPSIKRSLENVPDEVFKSKHKLFLDMTNSGGKLFIKGGIVPEKYYVILRTHAPLHDPNPEINSTAGHAWVLWAHQNPKTQRTEINGYGFWPDRGRLICMCQKWLLAPDIHILIT